MTTRSPKAGGVEVPSDGVAAAPVAVGLGADVEGHLDAVAGVVGDAADLGEFPALAKVAGAHLGVGLEAATGEDDAVAADILEPFGALDGDADDSAAVVLDEADALGVIADLDAIAFSDFELLVGEALASADGLDDETAPEAVAVADLEGLAAEGEDEADALLS